MNEQKSLKEKIERRFESLPDDWFQNELMEQAKHYLSRGRRFETLTDGQLDREWVTAFRQYAKFRVGPHVLDMADAWAELRIRGAELPTRFVVPEMAQLDAAIIWIDSAVPSAEFDRRLDEYVDDLSRPMDGDDDSRKSLS